MVSLLRSLLRKTAEARDLHANQTEKYKQANDHMYKKIIRFEYEYKQFCVRFVRFFFNFMRICGVDAKITHKTLNNLFLAKSKYFERE